ncbi:hypothetical protein Hanom_Chr12g01109161 [Helianthus anomalus]
MRLYIHIQSTLEAHIHLTDPPSLEESFWGFGGHGVYIDGGIIQSGKYNDLITDPTYDFARQIAAHSKSLNQVNPTPDSKTLTQSTDDSSHLVTSLEPS